MAAARTLIAGLALVLVGCARPAPIEREPEDEATGDRDPVDDRPPHERIDVPSLVACGACHPQVYGEWAQSLHARAWTNANVRSATNDFAREDCRPCHSPLSVFETGFDRAPLFRDFNHEDGVHCLSCHGLADGVAAARTVADAPCRPRREPRLLAADHCYPCHEPTHSAFQEYRQSRAFARGKRCADCHMPERDDGSGRSHGPHGGLNPEFVARALRADCVREGDEIVLTLRNRTGHKFPGEIPSRSLLVRVEYGGDAGREDVLLRKPRKGEDREDDRLTPDEVRELRFAIPSGATEPRVRVLFLPLPLTPPEAGFLLGEWRP